MSSYLDISRWVSLFISLLGFSFMDLAQEKRRKNSTGHIGLTKEFQSVNFCGSSENN